MNTLRLFIKQANKNPKENNVFFDKNGLFIGKIPEECVNECATNKPNHRALREWVERLNFSFPRKMAESFLGSLADFGSEEDLKHESNMDIAKMLLYVVCKSINETGEFDGLEW
jgi:hypothetical protein